MFDKVFTFFMTGTGNSYKVGSWFAEVANELGLTSNIQQIKLDKLCIDPDEQTLCVFSFPTHGFTAPWLVLKHMLCLPRGKGASAVAVPSRAGTRIQGMSLPGMEGTAGYLVACLLFLKGYKVKGVMGVDMPSNWTALHWGLSKENVEFIVAAAQPRVKHFATTVLKGQVYFDGIIPLSLGVCLLPISVAYLALAQFILSKLFFSSDKCVGCGYCATICAKRAITMKGKTQKRPYWSYSCDSCMACMNYCPHRAVEASPILAILFYYLTTIPISAYLLQHIIHVPLHEVLINVAEIIQYSYILISVFLTYRLLHTALGGRLFSIILSRLSHTYYFRRYHIPHVSVKEFDQK